MLYIYKTPLSLSIYTHYVFLYLSIHPHSDQYLVITDENNLCDNIDIKILWNN